MTDLEEINPNQYDITETDTYQAALRNRNKKRSALQDLESDIKQIRRKIRNPDTSAGALSQLQKRLTGLLQKAEQAEKEAEEAEEGFTVAIEQFAEEIGAAFEEEWRSLHVDLLEALRRLQQIDKAIQKMDAVRKRVNKRVPDRKIDENTTQAVRPFEVHYPAAADIREAVSERRLERLEDWMETRGYSV